jgi:hypothetical protein
VTGPPAKRPATHAAPPTKRANPDGIPVRLYDGALVVHAKEDLADKLMAAGAAESFRNGPRRYLQLRQGIHIPRTAKGWDMMEFLRRWHGDEQAAAYIEHKDRQSENLRYQPPSRPSESLRFPQTKGRGPSNQISAHMPEEEFAR